MSTGTNNIAFASSVFMGGSIVFSGFSGTVTAENSNMTFVMNSVSSTAEHAVARAAECGFDSRTGCQTLVALAHCQTCRKLFASSKEWLVRPGDFIDQFRREGSTPIVECDACAALQYEEKKPAPETIEILRALRASVDDAQPNKTKLLHDIPKAKRKPETERRARRKWAAWRIKLALAFKERPFMTANEIAKVMGTANPTARQAHARLWQARSSGFDIVVHGKIEIRRGYDVFTYCLKNGEKLLPPQDSVTGQFMKEAV